MYRRTLSTSVLVAGAVLLAAPASAQTTPQTPVTTPVVPGFFFWSIGANSGVIQLPKWTIGQTYKGAKKPTDFEDAYVYHPKPWGAGPEFVMGYALNRAGPLGRIGDVPRVELGLSTFFGQTTQSSTPGGSGNTLLVPVFIDDKALKLPNDGTAAKLETTVYSGETALRFKTSFKLSPRFQIIPSIAAIGGMALYRYRWQTNYEATQQFQADAVTDLKETIRSWHVGGELALQLKWQVSPRWSLNGGAAIALMDRHASYAGHSQLSVKTTRGDEGSGFGDVSDNSNTFAWRMGFNMGVTYDWGWARLSVSGFGYYDSAVPQIDHSTYDQSTQSLSSTNLTSSGQWAYGGRIALVFPISMGR